MYTRETDTPNPPIDGRWVTRDWVIAHFPIARSTFSRIPRKVLNYGKVGKSAIYDRFEVEHLFLRLKGTSLKALIRRIMKDQPDPSPESEDGEPPL